MTKPAQPAETQWIEIFRAGTHTDASGRKLTFTTDHLDEMVASYDEALHAAPIVVGHPRTDDPALGWISALKREGNSLYAQERDVLPEFEEARDAGMYRKRSASFYLPTAPGNPTPGKFYLRHVGNLGAMPPAVKGMADKLKKGAAAFNEDDGEGVIEFNDMAVQFGDGDAPRWIAGPISQAMSGIRDWLVETVGVDKADRILPRYQIDSIREAGLIPEHATRPLGYGEGEGDEDDITDPNEQPNPEEEAAMSQQAQKLADDQAKLEQDRKALDDREAALNEREKAAADAAAQEKAETDRAEAAAFADSLIDAGQLAPAKREELVAIYGLAQKQEEPLNFGEGDGAQQVSAVQMVRNFFAGLGKVLDFNEKSGEGQDDEPANFSAPPGSAVDADRLALDGRARAYMKANPGTAYQAAIKAVGG